MTTIHKWFLAGSALLGATVVSAHPFGLRFDSRGECEAAQAKVNHYDRDYVAGPVFGITQNGQAQVFFLESFQCELEQSSGLWKMVDHRGDDSAIGRAFDD